METVEWINKNVPVIADELEKTVGNGFSAGDEEGLDSNT